MLLHCSVYRKLTVSCPNQHDLLVGLVDFSSLLYSLRTGENNRVQAGFLKG